MWMLPVDSMKISPGVWSLMSPASDRIRMPVASLAQVYLGGASARVLLRQGLATGSARAAGTLDRAFEGPKAFLGILNGF